MSDSEEVVTNNLIKLSRALEKYGVSENERIGAALIMDNIVKGYPIQDLVTVPPFSDALSYLISADLIEGDSNLLRLTRKGIDVYNFVE